MQAKIVVSEIEKNVQTWVYVFPTSNQVTYKDLDKGNRIMESDIKRYVQLKYLKNLDRKLIKTESN